MSSKTDQRRVPKLHPIWNGIGCLMLVLIPAISWGLADGLTAYALVEFPELARNLAQSGADSDLYFKIGVTVVLSILLYLLFAIFVSLLYLVLGGRQNSEIADRVGLEKRR